MDGRAATEATGRASAQVRQKCAVGRRLMWCGCGWRDGSASLLPVAECLAAGQTGGALEKIIAQNLR